MIAFLLWLALGAASVQHSDVLERAERAYRSAEFQVALELYESALADRDVPRGGVLFNMGNCAFRLGRYPDAILYYRRAGLFAADDPELAFNLQMTEQQLGLDARPEPSLGGALLARLDAVDPNLLLFVAIAIQVLGLAGLTRVRGGAGRTAMLGLVLVGVALVARVGWSAFVPAPLDGVVMADGTTLLGEPLAGMPVVRAVRAGEVVRVAEMSDRWMRVRIADREGWVERSAVELVGPIGS